MQDAKEDIRSRLSIEDVIGEYVHLKRAGRSLKGLSPFQDEKTPSFMVSPDKDVWYDFSSNQGGDVYSFIMQVEGVDFRGAMEILARKAGVDLSAYDTGSKNLGKKKQRLYQLLEVAANYYHHTLPKNKHALEYVTKNRHLNKKVVQGFIVGYAPNSSDSIVDFLKKKGFSNSEMKDAGMLNRANKALFQARLMLPLQDPTGQFIGFTGRLIANDPKAPKYLNTPQTLLYDKSRHVYGLHLAKDDIRKLDRAVIVEGNLDVVSSHQAGVCNVVAAAGTALTELHLKTIKRFSTNISLAFDNDRAGLAATERAIDMAQALDLSISVISMPEKYKDPDEILQHEPELWQKVIDEARPVVDWVMSEYSKRFDIKTAEGKRAYSSACLKVIAKLSDPIEQEHYLKMIASSTDTSIDAVKEKFVQFEEKIEAKVTKKVNTNTTNEINKRQMAQDKLLAIATFDPKVRGLLIELDAEDFVSDGQKVLLQYLKTMPDVDLTGTLPDTLQNMETYVRVLLLRADERYKQWDAIDRYDETARLVKLVKEQTREHNKTQHIGALKEAEASGDEKKAEILRKKLNQIIKEN